MDNRLQLWVNILWLMWLKHNAWQQTQTLSLHICPLDKKHDSSPTSLDPLRGWPSSGGEPYQLRNSHVLKYHIFYTFKQNIRTVRPRPGKYGFLTTFSSPFLLAYGAYGLESNFLMPVCRLGTVRPSTVPKPTSPTPYQHPMKTPNTICTSLYVLLWFVVNSLTMVERGFPPGTSVFPSQLHPASAPCSYLIHLPPDTI